MSTKPFEKTFHELSKARANQTRLSELVEILSTTQEGLQSFNHVELTYEIWHQLLPLQRELGSCISFLKQHREDHKEPSDFKWTPALKEEYSTMLKYANDTPLVLSLLYDLCLLPECVESESLQWVQMLGVIDHMHQLQLDIEKKSITVSQEDKDK